MHHHHHSDEERRKYREFDSFQFVVRDYAIYKFGYNHAGANHDDLAAYAHLGFRYIKKRPVADINARRIFDYCQTEEGFFEFVKYIRNEVKFETKDNQRYLNGKLACYGSLMQTLVTIIDEKEQKHRVEMLVLGSVAICAISCFAYFSYNSPTFINLGKEQIALANKMLNVVVDTTLQSFAL